MATLLYILAMIITLGGDINSEQCQIYSNSGIITEVNQDYDYIEIIDLQGNEWIVEDAEGWLVGDNVSTIMYNNMTCNTIYDDVVLTINYEGYIIE